MTRRGLDDFENEPLPDHLGDDAYVAAYEAAQRISEGQPLPSDLQTFRRVLHRASIYRSNGVVPRLLAEKRMVLEALTSEDEIAHGEAWNDMHKRGQGWCAECGDHWPCHTQRAINRLLAALAPKDTP